MDAIEAILEQGRIKNAQGARSQDIAECRKERWFPIINVGYLTSYPFYVCSQGRYFYQKEFGLWSAILCSVMLESIYMYSATKRGWAFKIAQIIALAFSVYTISYTRINTDDSLKAHSEALNATLKLNISKLKEINKDLELTRKGRNLLLQKEEEFARQNFLTKGTRVLSGDKVALRIEKSRLIILDAPILL